ncbi:bifunctional hydroxymethylpyrimidine kinase/phosphomethylpyrimidine kinase [Chachezhania antarctica]|uniref:bifunctional hydroxymethylpyrimidine kinase/phosphomethylpyrimidine kinase n=1 Tax=Chachezhania antarctica TaxID=2340860 RepID=UPI000EAB88F7|nr:hydroxymethylpyrimidine/phosphomethylpyrimidine kinase [Chachezhania antarctica]|tara:strand:+ start:6063 stop:6809 length:747 start_codon:yes stop_codon:yes gene_type:complete
MTSILVIAGTDSSGGAGMTRDIATARALRLAVKPAVTAVTVQTDAAVAAIHAMPPDLVTAQIDAAFADRPPRAVKIGMLGTPEIARAVAGSLAGRGVPIVMDPVLRASSGGGLLSGNEGRSRSGSIWDMLTLADIVTPNLAEAAELSGLPVAASFPGIAAQADALLALGCRAVLIKGGHSTGDMAQDHLFPGGEVFAAPRLLVAKRGTGCTLSTAIACYLAQGNDLSDACRNAKAHVQAWMADADGQV